MMITMVMRALRPTVTAIACCFAIAWPASGAAQSWMYVAWQPRAFPSDVSVGLTELEVGSAGPIAVRRTVSLPGSMRSSPVITFDGRYVAWIVAESVGVVERVALFDRRTGSATLLDPPLNGYTRAVRADPTALRIFIVGTDGTGSLGWITVLEPDGRRQIPIARVFAVGPLSSDGTELFVIHRSTTDDPPTYSIGAIDPLTGTTTRAFELPDPKSTLHDLALSRDGRRLFVSHQSGTSMLLSVLDVATGAQVASRDVPPGFLGAVSWSIGSIGVDDQGDRLFLARRYLTATLFSGSCSIVLDTTTLQTVGEGHGTFHVVDRVQRLVVGLEIGGSRGGVGCARAVFETWADAATPISSVSASPGFSGCSSPALATGPEAPTITTHVVSGRRVTVQWSSVPGAIDYQVEAGTGTGLSNLGQRRVGATTTLSVDDVPSGTYYFRVRAVNEVGAGVAATDRVIVVP